MCAYTLYGQTMDGSTSYFADGYLNIKSVAGVVFQNSTNYYTCQTLGVSGINYPGCTVWNANQSTYGIVVGKSNQAESFDDYRLADQSIHGTGTGQLSHGACNQVSRTWDNGIRKWTLVLQRAFTNSSAASITIKEIGFYDYTCELNKPPSGSPSMTYKGAHALIRDVLPTPIVVAVGQSLTVTYTIEFQF